MHEELHNFERNEVWTLVVKPKDEHNIIGTKWVFWNKQNEDGQVVCNKARLLAQGYMQFKGMDYGETYAPVARLNPFVFFSVMPITMILLFTKSISKVLF